MKWVNPRESQKKRSKLYVSIHGQSTNEFQHSLFLNSIAVEKMASVIQFTSWPKEQKGKNTIHGYQ